MGIPWRAFSFFQAGAKVYISATHLEIALIGRLEKGTVFLMVCLNHLVWDTYFPDFWLQEGGIAPAGGTIHVLLIENSARVQPDCFMRHILVVCSRVLPLPTCHMWLCHKVL